MGPPRGVVASSVAIAYTDAVSFAVMAASRCLTCWASRPASCSGRDSAL